MSDDIRGKAINVLDLVDRTSSTPDIIDNSEYVDALIAAGLIPDGVRVAPEWRLAYAWDEGYDCGAADYTDQPSIDSPIGQTNPYRAVSHE